MIEAVSNVKSYGEGPVMIWFLEDYRDDVVRVVRVQHFELPDPTGLRHRHGHCVTRNHDAKLEPALGAAAPRWWLRPRHCGHADTRK